MPFRLLPVLDHMIELYRLPKSARFPIYLKMLQGETKADMVLPIANFNPMAGETVLRQMLELQEICTEQIMEEELVRVNEEFPTERTFQTALNLIDDAGGAWSNRYETAYQTCFRLQPYIQRGFCTPCLWTSEKHTAELIRRRTRAYALRTWDQLEFDTPRTLADHLRRERFVRRGLELPDALPPALDTFLAQHRDSEDHAVIFNFLFGKVASAGLGYREFGVGEGLLS